MTLYKMYEWEHNGYDDSDWYAVVYDDAKDELYRVETGTTRFADALHCGPDMSIPTSEVMEKAKAANLRQSLSSILESEFRRVNEPYESLVKGVSVRVLTPAKIMQKDKITCSKCNGSGNWVNPRNSEDMRVCFSCSGSGHIDGGKSKDEAGKQKWIHLRALMVGEVLETKVWGKFYHNGYNRPNRENTRVLVKFDTGTYWVAAKHLGLDQDIRSEEELVLEWKSRGCDVDFYSKWRTSGISML
jgi:hypothetical protein